MTSLILITGVPGVGKTTIIKKLGGDLKKKALSFDGFYTEEVRNSNRERIGFDVITFNGDKGVLARNSEMLKNVPSYNKVGKYSVCVEEFDKLSHPILTTQTNLLIIDEIGKMELKSKKFETEMKRIVENVKNGRQKMVATVPLKASAALIETLKNMENCCLYNVKPSNRDAMYQEICEAVLKMVI